MALKFNELIDVDVNKFLNMLSVSISLDLSEKRRVFDSMPTLSLFQVNSLMNVFKDEQSQLKLLNKDHPEDVIKLIGQSRNDWDLLQQLYQLPAFTVPKYLSKVSGKFQPSKNIHQREPLLPRFSPSELVSIASKHIIGQSHAVKILASALYYHDFQAKKRASSKVLAENQQFRQAPILLSGGSGSGKTHILTTLTKLMDIPTVIVDASTIVPAGIVGLSISSIGKRIIDNVNGDINKARFSIVVLDEFDKLLSNQSGQGVLSQLLTLLGGTAPIFLDSDKERDSNVQYPKQLDCNKVLFILAGSFSLQTQQATKKGIGFCTNPTKESTVNQAFLAETDLSPELRGRIGKTITLNSANNAELKRIFYQSPTSPFISINQQLGLIGCKLNIREKTLMKLLNNSQCKMLGARGLFQQFLALPNLEKILFDAPNKQGKAFFI